MRLRLTASALSLAALAVAGCGEDRLSQQEFTQRGNQLCREADRRSQQLPQPQNLQGVARQLDQLVGIANDTKRRFSELKPPEDKQAAFDAYLQSVQRQIDKAQQLRDAAAKGDEAALRSQLGNIEQLESETKRRARELGLTACANEA